MQPAINVLSFNSGDMLGATLTKARKLSGEIFVVDCFPKDGTAALTESFEAKIVQHPFQRYGAQRNWAIDKLPITRSWTTHWRTQISLRSAKLLRNDIGQCSDMP
jgi:hypothetical protein